VAQGEQPSGSFPAALWDRYWSLRLAPVKDSALKAFPYVAEDEPFRPVPEGVVTPPMAQRRLVANGFPENTVVRLVDRAFVVEVPLPPLGIVGLRVTEVQPCHECGRADCRSCGYFDPGDTKTGCLKRVRENETIAWIPVTDEQKPFPMVMILISVPDEELKLGWRDAKGRFLTGSMSEPEIARDWTEQMTHWARVDGPRSGENP
jgi:hypothetical protein